MVSQFYSQNMDPILNLQILSNLKDRVQQFRDIIHERKIL